MNKIRKLCIDGLCNVSSIRDANEAHLHRKKDLEILELDFKASRNCEHTVSDGSNQAIISVSSDSLLKSLRPHHRSLRELTLQNFNCKIYPSWLGSTSFSKLIRLVLRLCRSVSYLPSNTLISAKWRMWNASAGSFAPLIQESKHFTHCQV